MHDVLSIETPLAIQRAGRSSIHLESRGRFGANESEQPRRSRWERRSSFLVAIARELSTVQGGTDSDHLRAARRLLADAFDAIEMRSAPS